MSSKTTTTDVPSTGITIGAIVLAVLVVFAVFLPKLNKGDTNVADISLANTYPGGYISADMKEAWANADTSLQSQIGQITQQVKAETAFGDQQVKAVASRKAVNKIYLRGGNELYFVQVFASTGGAFSPGEIADPTNAPAGSAVQQLVKVGDGVCVIDETIGSDGTPAISQTQCQVSKGAYTVQVMSPSQAGDKPVAFADEIAATL